MVMHRIWIERLILSGATTNPYSRAYAVEDHT